MESLNLNNLASSLPSSSYVNAEKDLTNNFKAAALSLTTLFRSSKTASKRAYNAGYAAACHDLLNMIQHGVSTDGDAAHEVSIGRIMDYIEARLEAIRAREEEEEEEEERAAKSVAGPSVPKPKSSSSTFPPTPVVRRDTTVAGPPTPYTPSTLDTSRPYSVPPALSSPTPTIAPLRSVSSQPPQQLSRTSKIRHPSSVTVNPKELSTIPLPTAPMSFAFEAPAIADLTVPRPIAASTAIKRRREPATADISTPSAEGTGAPAGVPGTSRRRTRSWRGGERDLNLQQHSNGQGEAMDVEEEGPQRKRVARR